MLICSLRKAALFGALGMAATLCVAHTGPVHLVSNDVGLVEVDPAVAYNSTGDDYLVVWFNDRAGNDDIRARRVGADGVPVGPALYVSAGPGAERRHPEVAYNTTADEHLVVWEHTDPAIGPGIHARRVTGAGVVVGSGDIVIRAPSSSYTAELPRVAYASTSNRYLVVWRELTTITPVLSTIFGQLVSPDGTLDGSPVPIESLFTLTHLRLPDVAYNRRRNEFFVVWEWYDETHTAYAIKGGRVTGGGVLLAPLGEIATAYYDDSNTDPAVAALPNLGSEGQFLLVYNHDGSSLQARYFDGVFSDPNPGDWYVAEEGDEGQRPAMASQESTRTYFVADRRSAPPPLAYESVHAHPYGGAGPIGSDQPLGGGFVQHPAVAASSIAPSFLTVFDDYPLGAMDRGIYAVLWDPTLFIDGFESGNTVAWSATSH